MADRKPEDVIPANAAIHGAQPWISAERTEASCRIGNPLDSAVNTVLLGVALTVALVGLLRAIA